MIDANKRLVVMAENEGPPPAWYMNVWDATGVMITYSLT